MLVHRLLLACQLMKNVNERILKLCLTMAIKQECNSNGERVTFAIKLCFFFKMVCFFGGFHVNKCLQRQLWYLFCSHILFVNHLNIPLFSSLFYFLFVTGCFVVVVHFLLAIYCNYQLGMIFAVDMNQPLANASVFAPVKYVEWNIVDSNAMKSYKLFGISYLGTFLWVCLCYSHYTHALYT